MLKYNALIAGLALLALWALTHRALPEAASAPLIGLAILCTAFGAIASQPAAQRRIRRRRRNPATAAKRQARKTLDRSNHK